MYEELTEKLRDVARLKQTIHYGEIAPMLGLDMSDPQDRLRIGHVLGEISRAENEAGRPMLSVVVTQKGDERPGTGFHQLAEELGLTRGMDPEVFFIRELEKVYAYWSQDRRPG
jgi:hypothetical protein